MAGEGLGIGDGSDGGRTRMGCPNTLSCWDAAITAALGILAVLVPTDTEAIPSDRADDNEINGDGSSGRVNLVSTLIVLMQGLPSELLLLINNVKMSLHIEQRARSTHLIPSPSFLILLAHSLVT